jgi:hypothetical protein
MFYAASLDNSRANIDRVSCQNFQNLRHPVIAFKGGSIGCRQGQKFTESRQVVREKKQLV